jgi:hypothetical protein
MVQDINILSNKIDTKLPILTASDEQLTSSAVGDLYVNGAHHPILFKDVIGCPSLGFNLLSISKMVKNGHIAIFDDKGAYIIESKHVSPNLLNHAKSNAFIVGQLKNDLFEFDPLIEKKEAKVNTANGTVDNFQTWHKRLGHLNATDMKILENRCNGLNLKGELNDCETCIISKSKRKTYYPSNSRSKRPGEIIHFDVGIINTITPWGNEHYLLFVDDYSRYNTLYPIKKKSDCQELIKGHIKLLMNKFSIAPLIVRSDNAKEFFTNDLNEFLLQNGITHQSSCDYTHEQVGVVERMNSTISNSGNSLLTESGFPKYYWDLAYQTASYTRNVCPTTANPHNTTPYELYHGKKPDISNLRIFGEKAFLHIPKELRTKLDPKAEEWYFVGYGQDDGSKGWKLLDINSDRVKIASDVTFLKSACFPIFNENQKMQTYEDDEEFSLNTDNNSSRTSTEYDSQQSSNMRRTTSSNSQSSSDINSVSANETSSCDTTESAIQEESLEASDKNEIAPISSRTRNKTQIKTNVEQLEPENLTSLRASSISWKESDITTPMTIEDLDGRADEKEWREAVELELKSMAKHNVWTEVTGKLPKAPVSSKWVFKIKYKADGSIAKYKARLVVRGFTQQEDIDYFETFSPVLKHTSLRILLSIAATDDLELEQADVETAFLLPDLEEEIYMKLPNGTIVKLNKSIYGLKQAPRVWNKKIDQILESFGLNKTIQDPCVYAGTVEDQKVYLGLYVDDLILACKDIKVIETIKRKLANLFKITDIGRLKYCLGFEIDRDRDCKTLKMHQSAYISSIIKRANMESCKIATTPGNPSLKLSKSMCPTSIDDIEYMKKVPYRQLVGAMLYLVSGTRPDLAFSVSQVCRYMQNPGKLHWEAVKQIIKYLQGTKTAGIILGGEWKDPHGYVDSDYAGEVDNRRSTTGYVFYLNGGPVSWNCRTQPTVALSSTEAEYMALSTAAQEAIWLKGILKSLSIGTNKPIKLFGDNQGSLKLAKNPQNHSRTKHIDVRHHFIRDAVTQLQVSLEYIPTENNLADRFTKALGRSRIESLNIGLSA